LDNKVIIISSSSSIRCCHRLPTVMQGSPSESPLAPGSGCVSGGMHEIWLESRLSEVQFVRPIVIE